MSAIVNFFGGCVREETNAQYALHINITYDFNSIRFH